MIDGIASQTGFLALLLIFALGAIGAILFKNNDKTANVLSSSL
jgi:hypothetical protein